MNAPAKWQSIINKALAELNWISVIAYVDDLVLFTLTWWNHVAHLHRMHDLFRDREICLSASKAQYVKQLLEYAGWVVGKHGHSIHPGRIQPILDIPLDKYSTVKEVRSFLGACSYLRVFMENYALQSKCLQDVVTKAEAARKKKEQEANDVIQIRSPGDEEAMALLPVEEPQSLLVQMTTSKFECRSEDNCYILYPRRCHYVDSGRKHRLELGFSWFFQKALNRRCCCGTLPWKYSHLQFRKRRLYSPR